jgi:hypothetical protein
VRVVKRTDAPFPGRSGRNGLIDTAEQALVWNLLEDEVALFEPCFKHEKGKVSRNCAAASSLHQWAIRRGIRIITWHDENGNLAIAKRSEDSK